MKFQSNCNCNRLHLHVIDPMSGAFQARFEFMDQYKTENILIKLRDIYIRQKQTKNCSLIAKNIDCYR